MDVVYFIYFCERNIGNIPSSNPFQMNNEHITEYEHVNASCYAIAMVIGRNFLFIALHWFY